ncbi:MAG: hypothetical protein IT318_22900, partial [Anaerolineales bacterium]|nr:hypothetical protein [Anaerolineales bacterium]
MRRLCLLLLAVCLSACAVAGQALPAADTTTPPPVPVTRLSTTTPMPAATTPAPVCTPPLCAAGEVYACSSGNCPNGCGTGCATPTPTLLPEAFCQVIVRTPPPDAPTASVNGTPDPNRRVDPHVAVCLSAATVAVGQPVALVGRAVDIGVPSWTLSARENNTGDVEPIVEISGTGEVSLTGTARHLLAFIEAQNFQ